ncbi:hypothetical protein ACP3TY_05965 [Pseudomonas rustica]|uniref:hypothetical protein n=1 Tax=Pseudomonas TaxID=286 RepID=UPI00087AD02E|nr:hypothetical protein [Pseudomonas sp. Z003-0.4C(8344-21)]SDS62486.1 hypothetical protein SAMN05216496_2017 [Pseudomonas sp. Z003-0.4C(8344-21)]
MTVRCVGLLVSAGDVTVVDTLVPTDMTEPVTILMDASWKLPTGDRLHAYDILHQQCVSYLKEQNIRQVFIKASALPQGGGAKQSLLEGAELRGVIMAAAASVCPTKALAKAAISRAYKRKVDDCIKDDSFWDEQVAGGSLRKGSREAAMLVVSQRGRK